MHTYIRTYTQTHHAPFADAHMYTQKLNHIVKPRDVSIITVYGVDVI